HAARCATPGRRGPVAGRDGPGLWRCAWSHACSPLACGRAQRRGAQAWRACSPRTSWLRAWRPCACSCVSASPGDDEEEITRRDKAVAIFGYTDDLRAVLAQQAADPHDVREQGGI